jgi:predicted Abi (CAAX) family protease
VAYTISPRGKGIFDDPRFLLLTTFALGGATASYIVGGGSAWAAAVTHGIAVALWRELSSKTER